mgnify:CR=1 FL=1
MPKYDPEICPHCGGQIHLELSVQGYDGDAYAQVESITKQRDWLEKERERLTLRVRQFDSPGQPDHNIYWLGRYREALNEVEKALAEIKGREA